MAEGSCPACGTRKNRILGKQATAGKVIRGNQSCSGWVSTG